MQLTTLLDSVRAAFLVNPRLYFYLSPRPTSAVSCLCKPGSDKCTILNLRFPSDKIDIILGVLGSFEDVGRSLAYGLG